MAEVTYITCELCGDNIQFKDGEKIFTLAEYDYLCQMCYDDFDNVPVSTDN